MKQSTSQSNQESIEQYRKALKSGAAEGYQAVLAFLGDLRLKLQKTHPLFAVSALQVGQMDFSYFTLTTPSLKKRRLKVVILFIHRSFSFEVWLSGINKAAAAENLRQLRAAGWSRYELASNAKDADYIAKTCLVVEADFSSPTVLSQQVERGIEGFVGEVEGLTLN